MVEVKGSLMKRFSIRLIIALITFVVGVSTAFVWLIYHRPASPLSVCDVIRNRDSYISKNIRVRGTLLGYDEMGLYAPDCEGGRIYVHLIFDRLTWNKLQEKLTRLNGSGMHGYSIWVNATLSGSFEKLQDVDCVNGKQTGLPKFSYDIYCYMLKVSDVDDVESVSPNVAFPN